MPPNIDPLNYNNAGVHNCLYRGKNLGNSLTPAHISAIRSGTFNDLYIGDYWNFSNVPYTYLDGDDQEQSDTYTGEMLIACFDYYYGVGGQQGGFRKHHAVVVPPTMLYRSPMNDTATTSGGYVGSKMRQKYLRRALAIFEACFGAEYILTYQDFLYNAVVNGIPVGSSMYNDCKVELRSESMVYGGQPLIYRDSSNISTIYSTFNSVSRGQFPLYMFNKNAPYVRMDAWLRDTYSATDFVKTNYDGSRTHLAANAGARDVLPFALLGSL